jgi:DnaJ-class molecular chaperone
MRKPPAKPTEQECPVCNGTGYPGVRKIYPAPCRKCGGKGRIRAEHIAAKQVWSHPNTNSLPRNSVSQTTGNSA